MPGKSVGRGGSENHARPRASISARFGQQSTGRRCGEADRSHAKQGTKRPSTIRGIKVFNRQSARGAPIGESRLNPRLSGNLKGSESVKGVIKSKGSSSQRGHQVKGVIKSKGSSSQRGHQVKGVIKSKGSSSQRGHQVKGVIKSKGSSSQRGHQVKGVIKSKGSSSQRGHQVKGVISQRGHQVKGVIKSKGSGLEY